MRIAFTPRVPSRIRSSYAVVQPSVFELFQTTFSRVDCLGVGGYRCRSHAGSRRHSAPRCPLHRRRPDVGPSPTRGGGIWACCPGPSWPCSSEWPPGAECSPPAARSLRPCSGAAAAPCAPFAAAARQMPPRHRPHPSSSRRLSYRSDEVLATRKNQTQMALLRGRGSSPKVRAVLGPYPAPAVLGRLTSSSFHEPRGVSSMSSFCSSRGDGTKAWAVGAGRLPRALSTGLSSGLSSGSAVTCPSQLKSPINSLN